MKTISSVVIVVILFASVSTHAQNNLPPSSGHADITADKALAQRFYLCGQFDGEIWAIQGLVKSLSTIAGRELNANTRISQIRTQRESLRCTPLLAAVGLKAPK